MAGTIVVLAMFDDGGAGEVKALGASDIAQENFPKLVAAKDEMPGNVAVFNRMLSLPVCSPTRTAIHTGMTPMENGIGRAVSRPDDSTPAPDFENDFTGLPQLLIDEKSVKTAAFGKWHMGNGGAKVSPHNDAADLPWKSGPIHCGYQTYGLIEFNLSGQNPSPDGFPDALYNGPYEWVTQTGTTAVAAGNYITKKMIDEGIAWINALGDDDDAFLYLAFNSAHSPFHTPPAGTYTQDLTGLDPSTHERQFFYAMCQNIDHELQRFRDEINKEINLIFLGDNGPTASTFHSPFISSKVKRTVFHGGVWVPCIMQGPAIPTHLWINRHTQVSDLYATIAGMFDIESGDLPAGIDSISMLPYLTDPDQTLRTSTWVDYFDPNHGSGSFGTKTEHDTALYEWPHCYIYSQVNGDFFYDLAQDLYQKNNLAGNLNGEYQPVFDDMKARTLARIPS